MWRRRPHFFGGSESKLLDRADLLTATVEVIYLARNGQVQVALAGGYALQQYGSPRLTGDLDVVASGEIGGLPAERQLSFGGYASTTDSGVPVDVILRSDAFADLYEDALIRAEHKPNVGRVVSLEHLFAMKMVAGRAKDMADLEWIATSGRLNRVKARDIVLRFLGKFAAQEFDLLMEEIDWQASRGR
jgi:hypothetical protein